MRSCTSRPKGENFPVSAAMSNGSSLKIGREKARRFLSLEKAIAKSMGNLDSEIAGLRANLAATEAFLHVFVKMFLVSIPETTGEGRKALEANAKRRYERLLQQAALEINQPEPEAE